MVNSKDIIGRIAIVVFIILSVIFIVQIILKLIGESPSDVQMLYLGFGAILSYLFIMTYKLGYFIGETKEFMRVSKNTFRKLGERIDGIARKK